MKLLDELRRGTVAHEVLTVDASAYFNRNTLSAYRSSLAPLGRPAKVSQISVDLIDGLHASIYELCWPGWNSSRSNALYRFRERLT